MDKIVHPYTRQVYSIYSNEGKKIIKSFVKAYKQEGGAGRAAKALATGAAVALAGNPTFGGMENQFNVTEYAQPAEIIGHNIDGIPNEYDIDGPGIAGMSGTDFGTGSVLDKYGGDLGYNLNLDYHWADDYATKPVADTTAKVIGYAIDDPEPKPNVNTAAAVVKHEVAEPELPTAAGVVETDYSSVDSFNEIPEPIRHNFAKLIYTDSNANDRIMLSSAINYLHNNRKILDDIKQGTVKAPDVSVSRKFIYQCLKSLKKPGKIQNECRKILGIETGDIFVEIVKNKKKYKDICADKIGELVVNLPKSILEGFVKSFMNSETDFAKKLDLGGVDLSIFEDDEIQKGGAGSATAADGVADATAADGAADATAADGAADAAVDDSADGVADGEDEPDTLTKAVEDLYTEYKKQSSDVLKQACKYFDTQVEAKANEYLKNRNKCFKRAYAEIHNAQRKRDTKMIDGKTLGYTKSEKNWAWYTGIGSLLFSGGILTGLIGDILMGPFSNFVIALLSFVLLFRQGDISMKVIGALISTISIVVAFGNLANSFGEYIDVNTMVDPYGQPLLDESGEDMVMRSFDTNAIHQDLMAHMQTHVVDPIVDTFKPIVDSTVGSVSDRLFHLDSINTELDDITARIEEYDVKIDNVKIGSQRHLYMSEKEKLIKKHKDLQNRKEAATVAETYAKIGAGTFGGVVGLTGVALGGKELHKHINSRDIAKGIRRSERKYGDELDRMKAHLDEMNYSEEVVLNYYENLPLPPPITLSEPDISKFPKDAQSKPKIIYDPDDIDGEFVVRMKDVSSIKPMLSWYLLKEHGQNIMMKTSLYKGLQKTNDKILKLKLSMSKNILSGTNLDKMMPQEIINIENKLNENPPEMDEDEISNWIEFYNENPEREISYELFRKVYEYITIRRDYELMDQITRRFPEHDHKISNDEEGGGGAPAQDRGSDDDSVFAFALNKNKLYLTNSYNTKYIQSGGDYWGIGSAISSIGDALYKFSDGVIMLFNIVTNPGPAAIYLGSLFILMLSIKKWMKYRRMGNDISAAILQEEQNKISECKIDLNAEELKGPEADIKGKFIDQLMAENDKIASRTINELQHFTSTTISYESMQAQKRLASATERMAHSRTDTRQQQQPVTLAETR
jgi:hypothetical protein